MADCGNQLLVGANQLEDTPIRDRFGVRINSVVQRMTELVAGSHSQFEIVPVVATLDFQRIIQQDHALVVVETQR